MTKQIIESNKLIAEFEGYIYYREDTLNGVKGVLRKEGELSLHLDFTKNYHPEYHSSWDWLIPVVNKFIIICIEEKRKAQNDRLLNSLMSLNIKIVWSELVIAIKWYNNQNKITQ